MFFIHHSARFFTITILLIAIILTNQTATGATRHPAKAKANAPAKAQGRSRSQSRAEKRQAPARSNRAERLRAEARRRAEAARLAAIARQRALEEARRNQVQAMIDKDDTTGEDLEIRRMAVNALGHHAGTVVVMDPKTGRIYTAVNQQWAFREGFKPCSTIKLVTGLAGLNEKVIEPANTAAISDSNKVDLTSALAHSKNEYFQQVGGQVGFNKMISYARQLGLGEKTGINIKNEFQGSVPKLKSGFAVNHMSSHGDDFKVTALQLATLVSAMANGGKLITPFVPRTPQDETRSAPKIRRSLSIDADAFEHMVPGMIGSVSYGSGRKAFDPKEVIAGKTGTCTEHGDWVGLFTSYAPINNPKFAVVVIAQGDDGRNHFPAAVAGRIYRNLDGRFDARPQEQVATTSKSQTEIANQEVGTSLSPAEQDSTEADDEEADDADNNSANNTARQVAKPVTNQEFTRKISDSKVKRILMPIPNRTVQAAKPVITANKAIMLTAAVNARLGVPNRRVSD